MSSRTPSAPSTTKNPGIEPVLCPPNSPVSGSTSSGRCPGERSARPPRWCCLPPARDRGRECTWSSWCHPGASDRSHREQGRDLPGRRRMCQPHLLPGPGRIINILPNRCRRLSLLAKGCAPSGSPSAGRFFCSPSFAIHPVSSGWSDRELSSSSSSSLVAWGGSMRGRGRKLTHLGCHTFSSSFLSFCTTTTTTPTTPTSPQMASNDGPQWTAQRVRDTFLDYFQKNGHTFGALLPRHRDFFWLFPCPCPG